MVSATQGARTAMETPPAPVSPLIATPARAKRMPATAASMISLRLEKRSERWPSASPIASRASPPSKPSLPPTSTPGREQGEPALEAEHAADLEAGVIAAEVGDGEDEQRQTGAAEQQGQPLARLDRVAEHPLRHHRERDGATGEHCLDDRDRRHREGGDVDEPGHRRDSP